MSLFPKRVTPVFRWVWSHVAAGVALVLIVVALMIGYTIGSPASESMKEESHGEHRASASSSPQMYTCSMHPTVRLTDPSAKCPICFMNLIPVMDSSGGGGMETRLSLSESAIARSQIETTKVARFFPSSETRLFGKMVYDETSVARISAYFPGRIDRLFVNYVGVRVQQGDHLAEMYSPDLLSAFEELRQAKKSIEKAGDSSSFLRDTANQTLVASREKLRLFGLTPEQVEQIESGHFESDDLTIYAPIGGVVTNLATREGDYLDTGDPIATVSNLKRLWLDLEAYESQLSLLRWGLPVTFTVEAHPGEVFEGRVSFIEPMVDDKTRTAAVRVAVDNSAMRLKPGMFATAVVRSKIAADGAVLSDELAGKWVCPMHPTIVKDKAGVCDVCGMDLVSAESLGVVGDPSQSEMPMVIPRSAVLFTGTRSVVYVQVPDQDQPTYEGRTIELGTRAGEYYTVRSGLNEGDEVVVHGAFRIDSAMQILAKPSMMMPNIGNPSPIPTMNMNATVPESFLNGLAPVYSAYLDIQERLAGDDLSGFLDGAKQLETAVSSVLETGLAGEQLGIWRQSARKLKPDPSITTMDGARSNFEQMSEALMVLQDRFGNPGNETLSTVLCPMAFDHTGARWVQRGAEVNNPYFGSVMLRCGIVEATHKPIGLQSHDGMDLSTPMQHEGHDHD